MTEQGYKNIIKTYEAETNELYLDLSISESRVQELSKRIIDAIEYVYQDGNYKEGLTERECEYLLKILEGRIK